jgi:long-chain acyl-CoA synthetase
MSTIPTAVGGPPRTLPQLWMQRCREWALRPALRYKHRGVWQTITWGEYRGQAEAFGLAIESLGLRPGDCVAMVSRNRPELLIADMATQARGLVSCVLDPSLSDDALDRQLRESRCRLLVIGGTDPLPMARRAAALGLGLAGIIAFDAAPEAGGVLSFQSLLAGGRKAALESPTAFDETVAAGEPHQEAILCFSLGSTGEPKAVRLPQHILLHQAVAVAPSFPLPGESRSLSILPFGMLAERLFASVYPLHSGCVVHFPEGAGTELGNLREVSPELLFAPPRLWEKLLASTELAVQDAVTIAQWAYGKASSGGGPRWLADVAARGLKRQIGLGNLRQAVTYGAPASSGLVEWYARLGISLRQVYGFAEAGGLCAILGEQVLPGYALKHGGEGDIAVRPPGGNERHWLSSGDTGRRDAQGRLDLVMRPQWSETEDVVSTQNAIRLSPYICDAIVAGGECFVLPDEEGLAKFAQDRLIPFTDLASLARHPAVNEVISGEVTARVGDRSWQALSIRVLPPRAAWGESEKDWLTPFQRLRPTALGPNAKALAPPLVEVS